MLLVIFASYFRATEVGAFFGALAGTPVLVHVFNRLAPAKREREGGRPMSAEFMPRAEPAPREQVVVLRMEVRMASDDAREPTPQRWLYLGI